MPEPIETTVHVLDRRELATVLAALRQWQAGGSADNARILARAFKEVGPPIDRRDGTVDIATNGGRFDPLTVVEIDALCERLNLGPLDVKPPASGQTPKLLITIEGGLIGAICCEPGSDMEGVIVAVVDYDVEGFTEDELTDIPQEDGTEAVAILSGRAVEEWPETAAVFKLLDAMPE